jgi:hypothetical protein
MDIKKEKLAAHKRRMLRFMELHEKNLLHVLSDRAVEAELVQAEKGKAARV